MTPSHHGALAIVGRGVGVLRLLDLFDEQLKGLGDTNIVAGTGLGPGAAKLFGELLAVIVADLALFRSQIALVTNDADGNLFAALWKFLVRNGSVKS